jgi:hypothetical protein
MVLFPDQLLSIVRIPQDAAQRRLSGPGTNLGVRPSVYHNVGTG